MDVFLSAAPKQMDALETKGLLLEGTRKDLLRNEVVLIVPKDSTLGISSFQDLTRANVKQVALGEPVTVPAGQYAKEVLTSLGIYDAVNSKAILAKDVRQVLTYVETGNVDAGIVYATDAMSSTKVKVVATAPAKSHAPVIYPVAVIKASKNPAAARAFLDFLGKPAGPRHISEVRIRLRDSVIQLARLAPRIRRSAAPRPGQSRELPSSTARTDPGRATARRRKARARDRDALR